MGIRDEIMGAGWYGENPRERGGDGKNQGGGVRMGTIYFTVSLCNGWLLAGCSSCDEDATSDRQRTCPSTTVDHTRTRQGATARCQSTAANTMVTCSGLVPRHFVVTDDDLHDAEARLDDAETYVPPRRYLSFWKWNHFTYSFHKVFFTSFQYQKCDLCCFPYTMF